MEYDPGWSDLDGMDDEEAGDPEEEYEGWAVGFDDASGSEREGEIRKGGFSFARLVHIFSHFFCDTISSTRRVAGTESSGTSLYQFFDERTS